MSSPKNPLSEPTLGELLKNEAELWARLVDTARSTEGVEVPFCVECDDSRVIPDDDGVTRACPWCTGTLADEASNG